jgi:hypothetical protein
VHCHNIPTRPSEFICMLSLFAGTRSVVKLSQLTLWLLIAALVSLS